MKSLYPSCSAHNVYYVKEGVRRWPSLGHLLSAPRDSGNPSQDFSNLPTYCAGDRVAVKLPLSFQVAVPDPWGPEAW